MDKIIDGKNISISIRNDLKEIVSNLVVKPHLCVIQVGDDAASNSYIKSKNKACNDTKINFSHYKYEDTISEYEIINKIKELNMDDSINGILVQLPLPKHLNERTILETIDPLKDVDGLTSTNLGNLLTNNESIVSCTPLGIIKLLEYSNIKLEGKHVVIVGRSNLVGKPLINLCLNRNATVTVCHSKTNNLEFYTKQADILIVAVGHKHLINKEMVKDGVIIIDVGINKVDNKLYGDVDFDNVIEKVSLITPVPGGVGPMTVAMLLNNVLTCYHKQNENKR